MPWCPACDRFLSPSTVATDGTCPRCSRPVDPGRAQAARPEPAPEPQPEDLGPLPWHFWLLAGAVALYLGYRALQGIEWLVSRL